MMWVTRLRGSRPWHADQLVRFGVIFLPLLCGASAVQAQPSGLPDLFELEVRDALDEDSRAAVVESTDLALEYLARHQRRDGSFPSSPVNQPAITALGTLAMMSAGHRPGSGPYGECMSRAIDYILKSQQSSGMLCAVKAEPFQKSPHWNDLRAHALYNHGIGSLALSECYGEASLLQNEQIQTAVEKALEVSRKYQTSFKRYPERDNGGWRYMMHNYRLDSDLSVTSWQLMFYRSAKGAGFDVPEEYAAEGLDYVRRCYDPDRGQFRYSLFQPEARYTRAMSGAGIFSMAMAGDHGAEMAKQAGDWLLTQMPSFVNYNGRMRNQHDEYFYSTYYAALGMYQLGGKHWLKFYPQVARVLTDNQNADGSWDDRVRSSGPYVGRVFSTSLMTMVLTVEDQMLPIYQR